MSALSRLPWWLRPWSHARMQRAWIVSAQARADRLQADNSKLLARNAELDRRITQLHGPLDRTPAGLLIEHNFGHEAPGGQQLAFVIAAADRGNGRGVRVYASHKLAGLSFGMTPEDDPPPRFKLRATFGETLVIDKPSYPEAIGHWLEIVCNREDSPV